MTEVPSRRCIVCEKILPSTGEFFQIEKKPNGRLSMRNQCRECRKTLQKPATPKSRPIAIRKVIGTPEQCGCCGTTRGNIFGDVDSSTYEVYGYLCMKCHQVVRDFQGDTGRIRKALDYIEQTRNDKKAPTARIS